MKHSNYSHSTKKLIEVFLPVLSISILYLIKLDLRSDPDSSLNSQTISPSYPADDEAIIPLSFQDYVTALQAKRVCVANLKAAFTGSADLVISGVDYWDWPVPFVFCNSNNCRFEGEDATKYCTYKTLALAPMSRTLGAVQRMQSFKDYVVKRYPQLTNNNSRPFSYDFIQTFDSNEELQSYVTSENYGEWVYGKYYPKVAIGLVFDDGEDGKSYDYIIRVNATNFNSQEQAVRLVG